MADPRNDNPSHELQRFLMKEYGDLHACLSYPMIAGYLQSTNQHIERLLRGGHHKDALAALSESNAMMQRIYDEWDALCAHRRAESERKFAHG
jgi:hypothetical protein